MHYFESCALAERGDAAGRRAAVERALAVYPKDVDALIALYALPDNTAEQRADATRRIKAALAHLEDDIQAVPDDTTSYNEYAWLVANTEGDVEKATRYSKLSLVKSFDNASFLDTLAHCHAAAGRAEAAIRTQRLAKRQEPHNRTIQRNLERFEKLVQ
jgi:tetratricopeptide (TPR) repeat protein